MNRIDRRQTLWWLAAPAVGLAGCAEGGAAMKPFTSVAAAATAIESLGQGWRSQGRWTLPQVLAHAAQSVEYSIHGFPGARSALFQATLGRAAFAVFDARGRMSHGLDEPIPGAPALQPQTTLDAAITRLLASLRAFEAHTGPLAPHFAYGQLDKAQFTRAHLLHLDNHWAEFVRT